MDRIMMAFNMYEGDANARIDFELYVKIKCFLEGQTLDFNEKVATWMKIINPIQSSTLEKKELWQFFEKFARGKMQDEPILVSQVFADKMINLFELENMEDPSSPDHIVVSLLREKILDGTFSIDLLN